MPIINQIVKGSGGGSSGPKIPLTVYSANPGDPGLLQKGGTGIDVGGADAITTSYVFYYEYRGAARPCTGSAFLNSQNLKRIDAPYALNYAFFNAGNLAEFTSTGLNNLETVGSSSVLSHAFDNCIKLTSTDLGNLSSVSGNGALCYAFKACISLTSPGIVWDNVECNTHGTSNSTGIYGYAFDGCTGLTSTGFLNKEKLWKTNSKDYMFAYTFNGCTSLTSTGLNKVKYLVNKYMMNGTFQGCTGLTDAGLGELEMVGGQNALAYMFKGCTGLTVVRIPYLIGTTGSTSTACLTYIFQNCTNLTDVYLNSINGFQFTPNVTSCFSNFLSGVSGCTVHLPSNQTSYFDNYTFGGTNTTVLFDLPAVYRLVTATKQLYQQDKYSTQTSKCWAHIPTGENYFEYYYTAGTSTPSVGDTVYTDPECTISSGETIDYVVG